MNVEFIFALNFAQNITLLLLVFSKEAILFLIYLLADKAKYEAKLLTIVLEIKLLAFQYGAFVSIQVSNRL